MKALSRRRLADNYRDQLDHWAFLASTVTNGFLGLAASMSGKRRKPKLTEPEDFINKDFKQLMKQMFRDNEARPSKRKGWASHIADAKAKGLKGPW